MYDMTRGYMCDMTWHDRILKFFISCHVLTIYVTNLRALKRIWLCIDDSFVMHDISDWYVTRWRVWHDMTDLKCVISWHTPSHSKEDTAVQQRLVYYAWHFLLICVTWLIDICDMIHWYVWHIDMCDTTRDRTLKPSCSRCRCAKKEASEFRIQMSHVTDSVWGVLHIRIIARILQHAATYFNTLQHPATHCNTLQHTATHCNILQHSATPCNTETRYSTLQHAIPRCNTLQYVATHRRCLIDDVWHTCLGRRNTLQHTATRFNTLQHTVTPCNTPQHPAPRWKHPTNAFDVYFL